MADFVQTFVGSKKFDVNPGGSLPSALRRTMVDRFIEFDEYQLAKHNKANKKSGDINVVFDKDEDITEIDAEAMKRTKARFSIKRLIKLLHIREPVNHVMSILGKT